MAVNKAKKKCNVCKKEKVLGNYYGSSSVLFNDNLVPICKHCLKESINADDIESVKSILQKIDKPFVAKTWKASEESSNDTVGDYFRMINSLPQYRNATWADSDFGGENMTDAYKQSMENVDDIDSIETEEGDEINLTKDIKTKFGAGYTNREYLQMEKFYKDMKFSHDINTPQLKKQLIYLCKLQIQMDRALEAGDAGDFKKYNDSYEGILRSSGFRPVDRKSSSESAGVNSFSTLFEHVEKNGYVEPKPIEERMDLCDVAILSYFNYVRQLLGKGKLEKVPQEIHDELEKANGKLSNN